jgi:putative transposase
MTEVIDIVTVRYHAHVHAFVLMDNHFHLILSTPEGNLDRIMQYFMRETSKRIGRETGRINRVFGARYQRSVLDSEDYFLNALKYVFRNPVAAGLCNRVEDYPYSTLPWTLNRKVAGFALSEEPEFLFRLVPRGQQLLSWLNKSFSAEQADVVRKGLRRGVCRWTKEDSLAEVVESLTISPAEM